MFVSRRQEGCLITELLWVPLSYSVCVKDTVRGETEGEGEGEGERGELEVFHCKSSWNGQRTEQ